MKDKNQPKMLHRYAYPDAYTLLELKTIFHYGKTEDKIAVLDDIKNAVGSIPDMIAELVVNDNDVLVRQWLARNGTNLEGIIEETLFNDPDEYVRASAFENTDLGGPFLWPNIETFNKCDKVAKLAIMRRGNLSSDLVEKVFNFKDEELKIDFPEERATLVCAYLTNRDEIAESRKDYFDHVDGFDAAFTSLHYEKLWNSILEWPKEFDWLKRLVYTFVGNENKNKVEIFEKAPVHLKLAILEGCTEYGLYDGEIIELAMKEEDDFVKRVAYSKVKWHSIKENINGLLEIDDKAIIAGIGFNDNIPLSIRRQAAFRLQDLGEDLEAHWLGKKLDDIEGSISEEEEQERVVDIPEKDKKGTQEGQWRRSKTIFKIFSYGWSILINLVIVGVIFALFSNLYDNFQKQVCAILVIIYLSVQGLLTRYGLTITNLVIALNKEFNRIRSLLKSAPDEYEIKELQKSEKKLEKEVIKVYINAVFMSIAYLIAIWNLISTL